MNDFSSDETTKLWHGIRLRNLLVVWLALFHSISVAPRCFTVHIPKSALIVGEGSVVPHINEDALGTVLVSFVLNLPHADLHSVPCERDVSFLHLFAGVFADFLVDAVGHEADTCQQGDEEDQEDEREDAMHFEIDKRRGD